MTGFLTKLSKELKIIKWIFQFFCKFAAPKGNVNGM
jgi:hypothetical protein